MACSGLWVSLVLALLVQCATAESEDEGCSHYFSVSGAVILGLFVASWSVQVASGRKASGLHISAVVSASFVAYLVLAVSMDKYGVDSLRVVPEYYQAGGLFCALALYFLGAIAQANQSTVYYLVALTAIAWTCMYYGSHHDALYARISWFTIGIVTLLYVTFVGMLNFGARARRGSKKELEVFIVMALALLLVVLCLPLCLALKDVGGSDVNFFPMNYFIPVNTIILTLGTVIFFSAFVYRVDAEGHSQEAGRRRLL